jgi:hypothetical protein
VNAFINGRIASLKLMPLFVCVPCLKDGIGFVSSSGVDVGIVKKFSFVIIFWLTPWLNSFICFLMYLSKASLDHRPRSIIVKTGMPAKYMAIAAPLLAECRPISFSENPRISGPSVLVALRNCFSTCCPVKWCKDPSGRQNTFTGVSADDDVYEMIRRIILHQIFTGQRRLSPVLWCVIMSFLVSRFCCSKVMEIESARCSNLSEWGRFLFPWKNLMFLMQMSFVFLSPVTFKYSHERMAKKNAPMNSSHIALSIGDMDIL